MIIILILALIILLGFYLWNKLDFKPKINKEPEVSISPLKKAGYSNEEIKILESKLNADELKQLENQAYKNNLISYINSPNFCFKKLDRYEGYQSKGLSPAKTVMYINMDLDYSFYEVVNIIDDFNAESLINKYNKLSDSYKPSLVKVSSTYTNRNVQIDKIAYDQLTKMIDAALKDGLKIKVSSAYRTNQTQTSLYNGYVKQHGLERANLGSAKPGHSEHQTGFAIDLMTDKVSYQDFGGTKEYTWTIMNLTDYGFIIRYPESKTNITGYMFEPWHIRYVGTKAAKIIKSENITLEEYTAKYKKIEC